MQLTPIAIEVLLQFHASHAEHPYQEVSSIVDATAMLLKSELIERAGRRPDGQVPATYGAWKTTERGAVLVTMLCETPLPTCRWVDPRTGKTVAPHAQGVAE